MHQIRCPLLIPNCFNQNNSYYIIISSMRHTRSGSQTTVFVPPLSYIPTFLTCICRPASLVDLLLYLLITAAPWRTLSFKTKIMFIQAIDVSLLQALEVL